MHRQTDREPRGEAGRRTGWVTRREGQPLPVSECPWMPTGKPGWLLPCRCQKGSDRVASLTRAPLPHPLPQDTGRAQGSCRRPRLPPSKLAEAGREKPLKNRNGSFWLSRRGARATVRSRRKCDGLESGWARAAPGVRQLLPPRAPQSPRKRAEGAYKSLGPQCPPLPNPGADHSDRGSGTTGPPAPPLRDSPSPSPPFFPNTESHLHSPNPGLPLSPFPPIHLTGLLDTVVQAVDCTRATHPRRHHSHPRLVYLLQQFSES